MPEPPVRWVCESCGQELDDAQVFGGGYGHTVVVQDAEGNYIEDSCGPCKLLTPNKDRELDASQT